MTELEQASTSSSSRFARATRELDLRAIGRRVLQGASVAAPIAGLGAGAWLVMRRPSHDWWHDLLRGDVWRAARGGSRSQPWRAFGAGLLGASVGLALTRWQLARLFVEHAPYVVESSPDGMELRRYAAGVRAETVVERSHWDGAFDEGFRRLARYIFGESQPLTDEEPVVAEGTPVQARERAANDVSAQRETIPMTVPVVANTVTDASAVDRTVAFVLPAGRSLDTLPVPKDHRVTLREVPERRVAVLRFAGSCRRGVPAQMRERLLSRVRAAGLAPNGDVEFASYDPPTTLPFLRRNEIMVEVTDAH